MCKSIALCCFFGMVAALLPVFGQIGGGSITGSVIDASSAAVVGAKVTAINSGTNDRHETTTNNQGYFDFPLLSAGTYHLEVEKEGFRRANTADFVLSAGTQPRFDLTLEVGAVTQSINIVGAAPLVNATTADLGVVMDESKVESLPLNGRNFQQLIGLQAGANSNPSNGVAQRGGIVFNGSTALGNNMLLDGVDMSFGESNGVAGASQVNYIINTISLEAIQEFKSTSSAFPAEYGRATGGVVNITTKSGTNRFHGDLFEFFRNDKLDANDFFSNRSGLLKSPLRWNQYGGNLGGPVRRDKIFFFFNYEGAQVVQQQQLTGNVPTPALLAAVTPAIRQTLENMFPSTFTATANPQIGFFRGNGVQTNNENTYFVRSDMYLGSHTLSFRYDYNHQDYVTPLLYPNLPRPYPLRFHNALAHDTWAISPTIVNELRVGFNRSNLNRHEPNREQFPAWITVSSVGLNASLPSFIDFIDTTYSLTDNLSLIRGGHAFKAGFEARALRSGRIQGGQPTMYYNTLNDLIDNNPYQLQLLFGSGRDLHTTNYGFYVQDDWRITPRLQLNLGVRYEYTPPLKGAFNVNSSDPYGPFISSTRQPMFAPDRNNFAPRVGLVYDPTGKQKFIIRAGGAITYLPPQPYFFFNMAFIDPRLALTAIVTPQDLGGVSAAYPFPQSVTDSIIANPSLLPANFLLSRLVADYNSRDTYSEQWNFSVQSALTRTAALQVSYVGSHTVKLAEPVPLNLIDPATGQRPVAGLGEVDWVENAGNISYESLQVSFNQRLSHGLTLDSYYTYANALGYMAPDNTQSPQTNNAIQDPNNLRGSDGPIQGNIRHQFTLVHSYQIPTAPFAHSGAARAIFAGWTLQGIMSWRSGIPINVLSGIDLVGNAHPGGDRPDLVLGVNPYNRNSNTITWLNPQAFDNNAPKAQKRFGNLGFNALGGPSGFNYDAAIHKTFVIAERHRVTFRFEMFNAFNHKILGNPNSTLTSPTFGTITSLANSPRAIQLALKYQF